ncbi:CrcB family protein [Methanofollis aquaemaris]|uniref:Fluoride-specific ion channel FluC n=1 Tax=Methanofollis aquaemaris TaxID=126734 RepID=A0A8A3S589_9EURY|nr:CrcB family protein [Methanofollis aquaemaris]QSZ66784.1 CrcB family protein [Methanofollis aquaemaris]
MLLIGTGRFAGALLRYEISGWLHEGYASFPVGTLGVNVLGCFALSWVSYIAEYTGVVSEEMRIFLTVGLLGAFTTMSTFGLESFRRLEDDNLFGFGAYIGATLLLTVLALYAGRGCAGAVAAAL